MLTSQQIDTISGIVENYDHYVVYNYADYHDYQVGEVRDARVEIYVGSDISYENNSFTFGDGVECYYFTSSKYISSRSCPGSFTVRNDELVYTDLVHSYPSLCYFQTEYNNFDYKPFLVCLVVTVFAFFAIFRVLFGGK